jgi:hypothetical protein
MFDTIWNGARGHYLCSDGPSLSHAQRMVMEAEPDDPWRTGRLLYEGRGYRPLGRRFRDDVFSVVTDRLSLAQVCEVMESTGQRDMANIARALNTLVSEGRLARELVKMGRGRPRWVYWRP